MAAERCLFRGAEYWIMSEEWVSVLPEPGQAKLVPGFLISPVGDVSSRVAFKFKVVRQSDVWTVKTSIDFFFSDWAQGMRRFWEQEQNGRG